MYLTMPFQQNLDKFIEETIPTNPMQYNHHSYNIFQLHPLTSYNDDSPLNNATTRILPLLLILLHMLQLLLRCDRKCSQLQ